MKSDLIIDGDGHVVEVNDTYDTIDPAYLERRPVYTQASKGNIVRLVQWLRRGERKPASSWGQSDALSPHGDL